MLNVCPIVSNHNPTKCIWWNFWHIYITVILPNCCVMWPNIRFYHNWKWRWWWRWWCLMKWNIINSFIKDTLCYVCQERRNNILSKCVWTSEGGVNKTSKYSCKMDYQNILRVLNKIYWLIHNTYGCVLTWCIRCAYQNKQDNQKESDIWHKATERYQMKLTLCISFDMSNIFLFFCNVFELLFLERIPFVVTTLISFWNYGIQAC